MPTRLDARRILIFLTFAFGLAWLTALAVAQTGGLADSPTLPGTGLSLALLLIAGPYMWAPALAHLLTRWVTREGWRDTGVRPNVRGWPYWLAGWVLPAVMTVAGSVIYFVFFPQHYDPALTRLRDLLAQSGQAALDPWFVAVTQTLMGVLIAPLINGFFTFGEEFGWRAYLQAKLMPLGPRRALLVLGVIWGVWHWPVIAMGHNYGLDYPGAPWLGMLAMVWFTLGLSVFLGWLTLRDGSVWPAVIAHAAINGISALGALFVQGEPSPLVGPLPTGLIGGAAWTALALALLIIPGGLRAPAAPVPAGRQAPVAPHAAAVLPSAPAAAAPPEPTAEELERQVRESRYSR